MKKIRIINITSNILVFIIVLAIFGMMLFVFRVDTDIQAHARFILEFINGGTLPANFLYYLSIYILSFCSNNLKWILLSSVIVLSISVSLKFMLTKKFICSYIHLSERAIQQLNYRIYTYIIVISFFVTTHLY